MLVWKEINKFMDCQIHERQDKQNPMQDNYLSYTVEVPNTTNLWLYFHLRVIFSTCLSIGFSSRGLLLSFPIGIKQSYIQTHIHFTLCLFFFFIFPFNFLNFTTELFAMAQEAM